MKNLFRLNILKFLSLSMLISSFVIAVSSQTREQNLFSSEIKILNSAKIPSGILNKLAAYDDNQLKKCQENTDLRESNIQKHFGAAKIQINADGLTDFIVQAQTPCFMGAHNTTFWLFSAEKTKAGNSFKLRFDITSDDLKILKTKTNKYRDIETASLTANDVSTILWKFDGQKYKPAKCWREGETTNGKKTVECEF